MKIIVPITKKEMEYLTKEKHMKFGENGLFSTNGHYRKWYMAETDKNMAILLKFREDRINGK